MNARTTRRSTGAGLAQTPLTLENGALSTLCFCTGFAWMLSSLCAMPAFSRMIRSSSAAVTEGMNRFGFALWCDVETTLGLETAGALVLGPAVLPLRTITGITQTRRKSDSADAVSRASERAMVGQKSVSGAPRRSSRCHRRWDATARKLCTCFWWRNFAELLRTRSVARTLSAWRQSRRAVIVAWQVKLSLCRSCRSLTFEHLRAQRRRERR